MMSTHITCANAADIASDTVAAPQAARYRWRRE
jgi:hypothetical protein